jgi:WD40 repeat protein
MKSSHTPSSRWARRAPLAILLGLALVVAWTRAAEEPAPKGVVATLKGHTEAVYALAYSPDGTMLITGSFDQTLKLWDTATAKEIKTFGGPTGHQKMVLSVAFDPAGHSIASGSTDNTAKIWDVPSGSALREFVAKGAVNDVALSPDGTRVAAAGKDGAVTLWNAADGKVLFTLTGHRGPVTGVSFNANGQMVASSGSDRSLRFWNTANGQALGVIGAHATAANAVVISPNNAVAYSAGADGTLKVWQIAPMPAPRQLPAHGDEVTALALAPNGNEVLTGGADKVVRLSNFGNGQQVRLFPGATAAVRSVAYAPNGATIAAGTADHRLLLWNNAGKLFGSSVAHGGAVNGIAFHPQSTQLVTAGGDGLLKIWAPPVPTRSLTHPAAVLAAVMVNNGRLYTGGADKMVRSWNLGNNQMERQFSGHAAAVTALAATPNGQALASGGEDSTIRFWNQGTGKESASIGAHSGTVTSLAFSQNGQQLLSSSEDGTVKLWQMPAPPRALLHADQVTAVALSADGARLLTGCADKQVRLWNLANSQTERTFGGPTSAVTAVALSAKGDAVAAAAADKSLTVWNAANAQVIKKFALPANAGGIAFSPDGKQVAVALADKSLRLYDVAMGKEVKNFPGHTAEVNTVAFTPKGDQLISGSADKTVQVWNVANGMSVTTLKAEGPIACLALSKDGSRVAAGGKDKTVTVWTLADGKAAATIATPAEVTGVAFSADGGRLVVGGTDNRARVYGLDGKLVEFFAHEGKVLAVAYHGDGKRVISASADKTARVWTSALVWQRAQPKAIRQAVFSAKGDVVVAAGDEGTVKVWNAATGAEVKSIAAHKEAVVGLGLSADGTRLVTASADKSVKVWSLAPPMKGAKPKEEETPQAVFELAGVPESVTLSPNGTRVAVAVAEKTAHPIRVFDAGTRQELLVITDHTAEVPALAFQADNRTLVSASKDRTGLVADVGVLRVIEAHKGGVAGVEFHSNGTQLLSGGADKTVKIWEAATGKLLRTFVPLDDPVSAVAFSRDYTRVGAAAGKVVKVWSVTDGKELLSLTHPAEVTSVAFSVDRAKIVTGSADNVARAWDAVTGKELQFFSHAGAVRAVAFPGNNNNAVVTASADGTTAIHPLAINRAITASASALHALALAPNGNQILTTGADKAVRLWNLGNGNNERTYSGGDGALNAVAVSRNNALVAAGGADKVVRVWNFADGKQVGVFKAPAEVRGLAFSPNSVSLAAACADKTLVAWNVPYVPNQPLSPAFGKTQQSFAHGAAATGVVFAPDNATLYSGSADKTVKAWKLAAEAPTRNFGHPNHVDAVVFNSTGTQLATACHDGVLRIFDVAKGNLLRQISAHVTPNMIGIYCLAWAPDDKAIVTGSIDHSLKLWNPATGALVREFKAYKEKVFEKGHNDSVYSVAFSPDGKWIASGGADRVIKIWNVSDGTVVRDLVNPGIKPPPMSPPQSHPGWVYGLRFTKDGKQLVSVGDAPQNKGYLALWDPAEGKLLYGEEMPFGSFYAVSISPDGKNLAIASGPRGRLNEELNNSYIIKMPGPETKK